MVAEIQSFFQDLQLETLRVVRPSRFIFLCGGAIPDKPSKAPDNLRDYLCRVRPLRLKYPTVLAERAVQLYRDTDYHDLISFEEDIARIASVVLVIAESAGSLAELGAFVSNDTIRKVLRVIIQKEHDEAESFVRYGPIQRLGRGAGRVNLGVYPWTTRNGKIVLRTTSPHYTEMKQFILDHLERSPVTSQFESLNDSKAFYVIYWIIYVCRAISPVNLLSYTQLLIPGISQSDLHKRLFCMLLAKWIAKEPYSGKDYYFTLIDIDAFDYSFKPGAEDNKPVRRKLVVYQAHNAVEKIPEHVRKRAAEARKSSSA